ncbi:hypothetical protein QFZ52_001398 [Arthrobacter woluwensis]|uniref:hypothetical protein n=1 Tax=Arthrobacter woluwensis TaxID=156980 RepID=UPI0027889DB1|nr:hypothetical protein [Arthrobacter woluwensis]MDQ0708746.1 hypothetical protein [Arthrobacter woluwensis]
MIPALTVRPIVYTTHREEWLELLECLGAIRLTDDPTWTVLDFGSGRVALHLAESGYPEGTVSLGFETDSLDTFLAAVPSIPALRVERHLAGHGESVRVTTADGLRFLVDPRTPSRSGQAGPDTWVEALRMAADVAGAAAELEHLGLKRHLTETNGQTVTLRAAEGTVLVHIGDAGAPGAGFAVGTSDLQLFHQRLLNAGIQHDVIDETFGRTLRVPCPGPDGSTLWISQPDEDPVGAVQHP